MHLRTARLTLRPFRPEDAEDLVAITAGPEYRPEFLWAFHDLDSARDAVRHFCGGEAPEGHAVWNFAIQIGEAPRLVGDIQLTVKRRTYQGGLAYELHPAHWNKGYMTEAIKSVLAFGFAEAGAERIAANADAENIGSWRAMEKAGMRREGLMRHQRHFAGMWRDTVQHAAIREDFGLPPLPPEG
jgi:RimJ/RimL family protein N-acetyltransferase